MDPVMLARLQFGLTAAFHFLFPPLSIGIAWVIVFMGWRGLRTGDKLFEQMTAFWVKILGLIFAVGVATGIALEFQFGTNWSTYSRFVGDIFGSPLAAEGVFAFFLESVFMGVLLLGRQRVSKRFYWISSLLVAIGSTLSAFWIIAANSWQQTPVAYQIVGEGAFRRAELTNFLQAVFNPSTRPRYLHTVFSSILSGSFVIVGISAWYLLKKRAVPFAQRSLQIALAFAAVFALLTPLVGHDHAVQVARTQPIKLAAIEGLFETTQGAPLTIWGFPDARNETVYLNIGLPKMLSFLVDFDFNSTIKGLNEFPRSDWPPLAAVYYPYRFMILFGGLFVLLAWGALLLGKRRFESRPLLTALMIVSPLPWLTMQLGWLTAEFGRQPWVVYGLLRTSDAVSVVVPAAQILITLILFIVVYLLLFALIGYLIRREILHGPELAPAPAPAAKSTRKEHKR